MGAIAGSVRGSQETNPELLTRLAGAELGSFVGLRSQVECRGAAFVGIAFAGQKHDTGAAVATLGGACAFDGHAWQWDDDGNRRLVLATEIHEQLGLRGPEWLRTIGGEFAMASWFEERNQLVLASDPMGVRRVFWARLPGGGLLFTTSALAASLHPEVPKTPNSESIALSLCGLELNPDATHYSCVNALPPGHYLILRDGNVQVQPYFRIGAEPDDDRPLAEIVDSYRDAFLRAVDTHAELSSSIGIALSGGLDSTSILRALTRTGCVTKNLVAVKVETPGDEGSYEIEFARCAVEGTGVTWRIVTAADTVDWESVFATADGPDTILWAPLMHNVVAECKKEAVDRVLFGCQGDLVAGFDFASLPTLMARWDIRGLLRECINPSRTWFRFAPRGALRLLWGNTRIGKSALLQRNIIDAAQSGIGVPPWISHSAARKYHLHERWRRMLEWPYEAVTASSVRFAEQLDLTYGELSVIRHCSRLSGIEVGVPFADCQLVKLSARLPLIARRFRGVTRYVHREAMRGIVPEMVRRRTTKAIFRGYFGAINESWSRRSLGRNEHMEEWVDFRRLSADEIAGNRRTWRDRLANLTVTTDWLLRRSM